MSDAIIAPTPEAVMSMLKEGSELYKTITENFVADFVFYDKTLYDWLLYLEINITIYKVDMKSVIKAVLSPDK